MQVFLDVVGIQSAIKIVLKGCISAYRDILLINESFIVGVVL